MVEIREATIDEVEAVADLWLAMCAELKPEATPDKGAWIKLVGDLFRTGTYHIVVAEDEGRLVGFVDGLIYLEPSVGQKIGMSQFIYVHPDHRFSDTAPRLYQLIVQLVNGYGVTSVYTTCEQKTKALWERKGFVVERYIMRHIVEEV
ncbi:MAG: GNAT family N-acetyltransferase [Deltaproteobacteria bacterium]